MVTQNPQWFGAEVELGLALCRIVQDGQEAAVLEPGANDSLAGVPTSQWEQ